VRIAPEFFVRWRVRLGYPLAIAVLWFSKPTPASIGLGALVGILGLWLRAYAAGYLHKQEILTVTGPYARTRNPLYLGSAFLAIGAALAARSWISAGILVAYFVIFYSAVMRKEELELRDRHGSAFDEYARVVPLLIPRLTAARISPGEAGAFSLGQYKKNHEYQATIGFAVLLIVLLLIWRLRFPSP
jgi:protein-S-isoprenylcysteine O-methyltransferase Ste14